MVSLGGMKSGLNLGLSGKLTKKLVENLGAGCHGGVGGLYLGVDPSGARRWIVSKRFCSENHDRGDSDSAPTGMKSGALKGKYTGGAPYHYQRRLDFQDRAHVPMVPMRQARRSPGHI